LVVEIETEDNMRLMSVVLACVCSLSGCSVAGYVIGSGIDNNAPEFDTLTTCSRLDPGDDLTIYKKDGSTASGTVAEPLHILSFEQKVARITGTSSTGFDLHTGSMSNASLPPKTTPTSIVLRQPGHEDTRIPMNSIQHIVVPHEKNAAVTGLLLGVAVDIAVVAIISSGMKFGGGWNLGGGKW
jgi:hypothetical protein